MKAQQLPASLRNFYLSFSRIGPPSHGFLKATELKITADVASHSANTETGNFHGPKRRSSSRPHLLPEGGNDGDLMTMIPHFFEHFHNGGSDTGSGFRVSPPGCSLSLVPWILHSSANSKELIHVSLEVASRNSSD